MHIYLDIHDTYFHVNAAKDQIIKVDHNIWNVDKSIQLAKAWDNFPAIPKAPPHSHLMASVDLWIFTWLIKNMLAFGNLLWWLGGNVGFLAGESNGK